MCYICFILLIYDTNQWETWPLISKIYAIMQKAESSTNLHNCRIHHNAIAGIVMVHKRGFNKVRHRVSKIVRWNVSYYQGAVWFLGVAPTCKLWIEAIETLSPIPAKSWNQYHYMQNGAIDFFTGYCADITLVVSPKLAESLTPFRATDTYINMQKH